MEVTLGHHQGLSSGDVQVPKAAGHGIKVDTEKPTFGWRDITGAIETRGLGATDPDWAQIGSSVMSAYKFALNDVCWITFHVPHDYLPDSDFFLHVHFLPDGTNANPVKWQFDWMYADGHGQQPFPVGSIVSDTAQQTVNGTQYMHYVTETDAQSGAGIEPDGIIYVKMSRITNGATDNTDGIFVLTLDVHYQTTNVGTKNRAPNFYL